MEKLNDLISRSALLAEFPIDLDKPMYHVTGIRATIGVAPAVEAEPVVHAHWIMRGGRRYCSACQQMACVTRDRDDFWYTKGTKRCSECGAHMDEGVADE